MGVSVGATIGLGLAAGFGLNECEAGLPAQPAMARIRANPASARPIELRALATLGLAATLRLPLPSRPPQDDASKGLA